MTANSKFSTDPRVARPGPGWLLALIPPLLLLTHYAAVLPHELSHSVVAWILGIKDTPLNLDWGGTSLANILLLVHIDENVDYTAALDAGKHWQAAVVAFAGPGLANGGLYLLCRRCITAPRLASRPIAVYVLFWFLLMNLANLYDYVPLRVFTEDGDVHHFLLATGLSPWAVYVVGGFLVLWAIVDFYHVVLPLVLTEVGGVSRLVRAVVLVVTTSVLFGYFAIPGLEESDPVSHFMAWTSVLTIPVVIVMRWRSIVLGMTASLQSSAVDSTTSPPTHP